METSTPITALTTKIADSHTRSAPSASATKLGSPGVSRRLILRSCHSNELSDALRSTSARACSSASASETVVPSVTDPEPVDDAGLEQQRLVQRGLAAAAVADEGDVPDAVGPMHASSPLLGVRATDPSGKGHEAVTPDGAASGISRRAASAAAGRPSCAAGRRATRSRRGPRRSLGASGSRSSRARRRASRARAGGRSRRRRGP